MKSSVLISLILICCMAGILSTPVFSEELKEVGEITLSTEKNIARKHISKREGEVKDLILQFEQMGHISRSEADSFFTQLESLAIKLKSTMETGGSIGEYMDLAEDLDTLAHRISTHATVNNVATNLFEIDDFSGQREFISDTSGETTEIVSASPAKLKILLQTRKEKLQHFLMKQDFGDGDIGWRIEQELQRIAKMEKFLSKPDLSKPIYLETSVPVAVQRDLLGERILGIVHSYRFRPITGVCMLTPKVEERKEIGELSPQLEFLKERAKKEYLSQALSLAEYTEFQNCIRAIERLEREYSSDGLISDDEWITLYSAVRKLDQRVASTIAYRKL